MIFRLNWNYILPRFLNFKIICFCFDLNVRLESGSWELHCNATFERKDPHSTQLIANSNLLRWYFIVHQSYSTCCSKQFWILNFKLLNNMEVYVSQVKFEPVREGTIYYDGSSIPSNMFSILRSNYLFSYLQR